MKYKKRSPSKVGRASSFVRDDDNISFLVPLSCVQGGNSPEEIFETLPLQPQFAAPGDPLVHGEIWGPTQVQGGTFLVKAVYRIDDNLFGFLGFFDEDMTFLQCFEASMPLNRLVEMGASGIIYSPPKAYSFSL